MDPDFKKALKEMKMLMSRQGMTMPYSIPQIEFKIDSKYPEMIQLVQMNDDRLDYLYSRITIKNKVTKLTCQDFINYFKSFDIELCCCDGCHSENNMWQDGLIPYFGLIQLEPDVNKNDEPSFVYAEMCCILNSQVKEKYEFNRELWAQVLKHKRKNEQTLNSYLQ